MANDAQAAETIWPTSQRSCCLFRGIMPKAGPRWNRRPELSIISSEPGITACFCARYENQKGQFGAWGRRCRRLFRKVMLIAITTGTVASQQTTSCTVHGARQFVYGAKGFLKFLKNNGLLCAIFFESFCKFSQN
jgi:hypothetical protein